MFFLNQMLSDDDEGSEGRDSSEPNDISEPPNESNSRPEIGKFYICTNVTSIKLNFLLLDPTFGDNIIFCQFQLAMKINMLVMMDHAYGLIMSAMELRIAMTLVMNLTAQVS